MNLYQEEKQTVCNLIILGELEVLNKLIHKDKLICNILTMDNLTI